jgi:SAM-dependent methyltransferase
MSENSIFRQLDRPWLYRLTQAILAPGADQLTHQHIQRLLSKLPGCERILDVGCGPASWLWQAGLHPVGLDISRAYSIAFNKSGEPAVTASADALPFPEACYGGVWSIGMLHHLPDEAACQAVREILRVGQPGGYVVIFDAVFPAVAWRKPLAWAIRRIDRGRFVRSQEEMEELLPSREKWSIERCPYSYNGLEILTCWLIQ